jgi:hydrogenase-4 component E
MSPPLTLMLGFGALSAGYFLTPQFAVSSTGNPLSAGMAVALLFIGMLFMITRRLAISQVIGFLIMENGIFLYGLTQTKGMPHLVEMAVVFEALIAVLIAGLVILRINRSFEHIDVTQMRGLRH